MWPALEFVWDLFGHKSRLRASGKLVSGLLVDMFNHLCGRTVAFDPTSTWSHLTLPHDEVGSNVTGGRVVCDRDPCSVVTTMQLKSPFLTVS